MDVCGPHIHKGCVQALMKTTYTTTGADDKGCEWYANVAYDRVCTVVCSTTGRRKGQEWLYISVNSSSLFRIRGSFHHHGHTKQTQGTLTISI